MQHQTYPHTPVAQEQCLMVVHILGIDDMYKRNTPGRGICQYLDESSKNIVLLTEIAA